MDWPRTVGELRGEAALAEATIGELAAHLNAALRGDLAALLGDCADFVSPDDDGFGRRPETPETVWDRFRRDSDLYDLDVKEAAAAIKSGPARWDALDEWTPTGGVDGDPYAVCRYAWGPLRARVQLTAAELLAAYLAGDAELALYRTVLDYGDGPTEFIWPRPAPHLLRQTKRLRRHRGAGEVQPLGAPGRLPVPARALLPGLRRRPLLRAADPATLSDSDETAPLGDSEPLDALPPATLTAIARDGADAIACDLRR